ncbi:hypothetical protein CC85DRAFT_329220 [Cutaneotrichosporon oleaginosum]|uniref:F-box domain-containing protein n=1 Tax=Cutaneotrichosporon oleaginosum TaxID=879819 RepID=A0A0J0XJE9_9TREE|nr:uncharacterized protein CC85DRAFT_329220 [Cutaneotrichosporon oleaginosum]KLT41230.1 hypothetical protein CC85DRAFT_329220 [Cutaneotrichosporon oleaginosum]TXT05493.1 hypothetical protein COLE_06813 [Cutaneotrichosporon oleaginosum]
MSFQDPLTRLGTDVFVEVLVHLNLRDLLAAELVSKAWRLCAAEHSSHLWRTQAYSVGVERVDLAVGNALAATSKYPWPQHDMRPIADRTRLKPGRWRWRQIVQENLVLLDAWARAACTVEWVTPFPNTVWRIKSDPESGTMLATSRVTGELNDEIDVPGLQVVDRRTSQPLWSIPDLQGYSHLEAGAGFFVINRGRSSDGAFEVWRNDQARKRSVLPKIGVSNFTGESFADETYDPESLTSPLPRGHYEHFRTLLPPALARAYRLHIDREGTSTAAAVLASCATAAIHIWHLDEAIEMETIKRGIEDQGTPNYIELDDNFVFVCDDWQMHVYLRETQAHLVSFPPMRGPPADIARLGFPLSITDDFKAIPDSERAAGAAPVGRAIACGVYPRERAFKDVIERSIAMMRTVHQGGAVTYGFSACHFTSRHLVCTTEAGGVLIVRNYRDVFAQCLRMEELDPPLASYPYRHVAAAKRAKHVADNSIIIGLGTTVKQLTTYNDHIVFATSFNVLLLDGRAIPDIPARALRAGGAETASEQDETRVMDDEGSDYSTDDDEDDGESEDESEDDEPEERKRETPARRARPSDADSGGEDMPLLDSDSVDSVDRKAKAGDRFGDDMRPTLRCHVLLGNHQQSMKLSSCLQADARSIYVTYWASGEFGEFGVGGVTSSPPEARDGLGMCIKAWTFGGGLNE